MIYKIVCVYIYIYIYIIIYIYIYIFCVFNCHAILHSSCKGPQNTLLAPRGCRSPSTAGLGSVPKAKIFTCIHNMGCSQGNSSRYQGHDAISEQNDWAPSGPWPSTETSKDALLERLGAASQGHIAVGAWPCSNWSCSSCKSYKASWAVVRHRSARKQASKAALATGDGAGQGPWWKWKLDMRRDGMSKHSARGGTLSR